MRQVWHFGIVGLLIGSHILSRYQVRLQALAKVHHALDGIDDSTNDQEYCEDCENRQFLINRPVFVDLGSTPDPNKFEDEVDKTSNVDDL